MDYLILFAIIFAIHLAPAFTPPTWPVIVFYTLEAQMPVAALILIAASAAALGRSALALGFRFFGHRLPVRLRHNLEAAHQLVERRRGSRWIILALFFVGSSSAPLFEAAGLARLRLLLLTPAYFVGRIPRYGLYLYGGRTLRETNFWQAFHEALTSPLGIVVEVLMIALIVALIRIDWSRWLKRNGDKDRPI